MSGRYNDDDDDNNNDVDDHDNHNDMDEMPRGVISRRARWAGEQMEIDHQQDSFRNDKAKTIAAVDIRQFQNHEVGKGYQAKHVIRQASAPVMEKNVIRDMTGSDGDNKSSGSNKAMLSNMDDYASTDASILIQNDGLRAFRRELEDLLK